MISILMTIAALCGPQNTIIVNCSNPKDSGLICQQKLLKCVQNKAKKEYDKCKENAHLTRTDCVLKQTEEQLQSCVLGEKWKLQ